jgi:hypothetical protein
MAAKSKKKPGRDGRPPISSPALAAAVADVVRGLSSAEEAAERHGIPTQARTVRRRAQAASAGRAPSSPASASTATTPGPPAGAGGPGVVKASAALPQGGPSVSTRPDLLEVLRRIGRARNAAAWAEVEEGLEVHTRGGEDALAPWLARPVEAVEVGVDELAALRGALDLSVELAARAEPGGPALRALAQVASLGKSVASVRAKRPAEPKPDEVQEAIRAEMETCVEHLLRPVREAAARLQRDRAALLGGLDVGPATVAEISRRVDAMLGAGPA